MAKPIVDVPLEPSNINLDVDDILREVREVEHAVSNCRECLRALVDVRGELLARISCAHCQEMEKSQ